MTLPQLTVLNRYELLAGPQAFTAAITALAGRVQRQGEPGVLAYRFFVQPQLGQARAVIDYATPQAWIGDHQIAMPWPEMAALHRAARLEEVTFLGTVTPDIHAWIGGSGLRANVIEGFQPAAGFIR